MATRSTWHIYKKIGTFWIADGFLHRPNDIFPTPELSTQSKTQRAKGDNVYPTPSTKYIDEIITFTWYYDDGTVKNRLESYVEEHTDIKVVDHSNNEYTGRFLSVNSNWLVGESPDRYDIAATFEPMSLMTASSYSSSVSSSSSSNSSSSSSSNSSSSSSFSSSSSSLSSLPMVPRIETQYNTATIPNGDTSVDVTLGSNISNLSRAFLLMWSTGTDNTRYQATGYLWDDGGTTKIRFERYGTNSDCLIGYMVVECKNREFRVQRGEQAFTNAEITKNIDVGYHVNTTRSFVIVNGRADVSYLGTNSCAGYFTSEFINIVADETDDITVERAIHKSVAGYARYEVVEWSTESAVTVQTKEKSLTGNMSAGITDTIDVAVIPTQIWLYTTYRHEDTGLEQTSIRDVLTDGTTITFDRYDAGDSYDSYARWWAIEFPVDVTVEHLTDTVASGDLTEDTLITEVTLANAFAWASNNCNGTGEAHPRDRFYWQFTSATNVRATRGYITQAAQMGIQIIDTSAWTYGSSSSSSSFSSSFSSSSSSSSSVGA